MKGRRWVTGIGVGLAVLLIGGTMTPQGMDWWGPAMLVAAVLIAVGIARGI